MADPEAIQKAIETLTRKRLYIGVPMDKDPRPGSPIGNASLGYIHEFGSPARNIPARPHLVPGVEAAMPEITKYLEGAAKAALEGDIAAIDIGFENAGIVGARSVQDVIHAKIPPPLALSTIERREGRVSFTTRAGEQVQFLARGSRGQAGRALGPGEAPPSPADFTPLFDSGDYLKSIVYVVRDA